MTGYMFPEYSERTSWASEIICLYDQPVTKSDFTQAKSNHFTERIQAWAGSDHVAMIMNSTLVWKLGDSVSIPSSVIKIVQQIAQSLCLYFYSIICLSFSQLIKTIASCHLWIQCQCQQELEVIRVRSIIFFSSLKYLFLHCQFCEPLHSSIFSCCFWGRYSESRIFIHAKCDDIPHQECRWIWRTK